MLFFHLEPWLMVIGGRNGSDYSRSADFISLDPDNHPVPECLQHGRQYPVVWFEYGVGGTIMNGMSNWINVHRSHLFVSAYT